MLDFYVKTGIRFSLRDKRLFEITEVEITRVDCFIIEAPSMNNWGVFLRLTGTPPCLSAISAKENSFRDFLFTSLNLIRPTPQEEILSFKG